MSDKRNINLTIDGIQLNMNIPENGEEVVRKAAKEINERVSQYKLHNKEPEPFYFLAVVALQHTIKMLQQDEKFEEIEKVNLKLEEFFE